MKRPRLEYEIRQIDELLKKSRAAREEIVTKKNIRLLATMVCLVGSALLMEHLYNYGFDVFDFIGHEWPGLILVIVSAIIGVYGKE